MRNRTEPGLSNRFRKLIFLLVFLVVSFGAPVCAQKNQTNAPSPPKYDLNTEAKRRTPKASCTAIMNIVNTTQQSDAANGDETTITVTIQ